VLSVIKRHRSMSRGFTLIEMLVVLTIAVILLAIGIPNMTNLFQTNRLATTTNELVATLNLARSEAIRRGASVVMLSTAGARNWGGGWSMFVDLDGNNVRDTSLGSLEDEIRRGNTITAPATIVSSAGYATVVQFDGQGRMAGAGPGLFLICDDGVNVVVDGQSRARAVIIGATGRVRVAANNASQQPLNDAGAAITSCSNPS